MYPQYVANNALTFSSASAYIVYNKQRQYMENIQEY